MLILDGGGRNSGTVKGCDGREGADSERGEGGGSHRGEGRGGRGGREEDATRSERGEHIDVHCHPLSSHSTLVVRDGDVKRGDKRVTRDSECEVERGEKGVHVGAMVGVGGLGGVPGPGGLLGVVFRRDNEGMR